jgi:hypothetical protein
MNGVTVAIPTIPPRLMNGMLRRSLDSVWTQRLLPVAVEVALDLDGSGEARTRNRALGAVRSRWTAFLDDDDTFLPDHLEVLMEHAEATEADVVYSYFEVVGGSDPLNALGKPFDPDELMQHNWIPVTTMVRTELAKHVRFPEDDHLLYVDWLFLKGLVKAGAKFSHVPKVTWQWHHHGHNSPLGQPNIWVQYDDHDRTIT